MKINIEAILNAVIDDNEGALFGHEYFIDETEHCLHGKANKDKEYFIDLLYLPECTGIEITEDRIMIYDGINGDDIALLIDDRGYRFPDSKSIRKINNDIKVTLINQGCYDDYLANKGKSMKDVLEELKELTKGFRGINEAKKV